MFLTKYLIFIIIFFVLYTHRSYGDNSSNIIHSCIHDSPVRLIFNFTTDKLVNFAVFLVRNTEQNCINPSFPAIGIKTTAKHNAWLHIVYTDSKIKDLQIFIDSQDPSHKNSIYPFYTLEADFYDAPFWTYSSFNKPLSYWQGHAYALYIDYHNKTIVCLGGIRWGFKLPFLKTKPVAIIPRLLKENEWNNAWQIVQEKLPGYRIIETK